jgi:hypothetical protein
VTDGQDHAVLHIVLGAQETRDFLLAQHGGQLFRLVARRDVVLDDPGSFEGDRVEKPKRGERDDDRTGREPSLPGQMDQIGPDLGPSEKLQRLAKMAGEANDLRDPTLTP